MNNQEASQKSNSGIITFRNQDVCPAERTIVITGPSRSGTTMMAQIIRTLGIHLGDTVDVNLFEDIEIREATMNADMQKMDSLIQARNDANKAWGWKFPGSLEHLSKFSDRLRNPMMIFTFRDPVATSVRNQIYEGGSLEMIDTMEDSLNYMKLATEWIRSNEAPTMCISYEKALLNPDALVDEVIRFLQVEVDENQRFAAIEQVQLGNTRYLSSNLWESHQGFIDIVHQGLMSGWAHNSKVDGSAKLEIKVNLKKVAAIDADLFREDLKSNGIGDGKCGFQFDLNPYLQREVPNRIDVCFADTEYPLQGSPKFC